DVVNGLLDRLEDGGEERQVRIVTILGELLPSAMATAEFGRASSLLEEVVTLASRPGLLSPPAVRAIRSLFDLLASEQTIVQLAEILEEMPDRLADQAVLRLLSYFPPGAIAAMMRATDRIERPEVRRAFEACVQRLAEGNRDQVVDLLDSDDPAVLTGALRWIGRLEIGSAAGRVGNYLDHADAAVRVAAVEALVSLRAAAAADGIVPLLRDGSREVRISAARALGALGYAAARDALEDTVSSKRLREADRTEKLAFFEAFGRLTGPDGVPVLDRILNGRGWFGRGESAEVRACAVVGLSRIRHPTARDALEAAAGDTDPVVRTAVARALKGDAT
ncbi:MAG: HEAT repeat domain-containing protein, partial [Gemmatimonadota bacterium]